MERVRVLDKSREWDELSVALTDDVEMRLLNRRHRARPEVTDVLSFCYGPIPGGGEKYSGEIVVNVQRAAELGKSLSHGPRWDESRELALYIAHGCNHLAGETDSQVAGRMRMRRRELRWLRAAEAKELVDRLLLDRSPARRKGREPC